MTHSLIQSRRKWVFKRSGCCDGIPSRRYGSSGGGIRMEPSIGESDSLRQTAG